MTPSRWGELDELYHAARVLPPSERDALLQRADPKLRAMVLSILAQEGDIEDGGTPKGVAFLDRPAWEGYSSLLKHSSPSEAERPISVGEQLGPYRIEQKIGQGESSEIMIQAAAGGPPVSFLGHARGASKAQFNPGVPRWIAYDFDDSGRREIYVQEFVPGKPVSSARWQISDAGGVMPRWRGDGKEIFYLSLEGKMMAVRVSTDGGVFQSSTPQFLFNASPPQLRTTNISP